MPAPRRLVPVLATVALTLPAAPAHAQGAGDDQYQDPFANTGKSSPSKQHRRSRPAPRRQVAGARRQSQAGLSRRPPATTAAQPQTAAAPAATALPRTGSEIPGMALLGLGLVLSGVGLRLRTRDDTLS